VEKQGKSRSAMKSKYSSGLKKAAEEQAEKSRTGADIMHPMAASHTDAYPLVQKVREGDREAFKTLTHLYQRKVYLLAYSFFRNRDDALDVVQETFLRFYQKAHMYQEGHSFQNWLLQIAKNLCIDYYRKHYRHEGETQRDKPVEELNLTSDDPSLRPDSLGLNDAFSECLEKLSERQRMIFVMKHYNQLKYTEIAQILDIAVGTVKSLNFKAIQNLKVLMGPYVGEQT
jgi:RNA polymerase sigma-70 factor (ECF subfamily)